ncbi:GntR family transcriptional regulator [Catellatospora sp. KI3]|uniref:GntR family transcriptional regulator n=1 Tax=Catellatospora sp. KI3 TaxID=3041620 RepID=UPI00248262AD|nr:GntR family transcriptional regulator [Catellatospora sp. KI3]MDI1462511.1 GntR family transcriptional regulator [Catellatospora sp. KI3]
MSELPEIAVDPGLHVPPYEQIRQQLADLITGGVLATGHRLPPIRQLAADLGLAVGTVARAYQELESAGLVHTRRAAGTAVAPLSAQPAEGRAETLARQYAQAARRLGLTADEALAAVARHWPPTP